MTFDEWARQIGSAVANVFPHCTVKSKRDDIYRWTYGAKECQLYAVSDSQATFITLRREARSAQVLHAPVSVKIDPQTLPDIADRIVRCLEVQPKRAGL